MILNYVGSYRCETFEITFPTVYRLRKAGFCEGDSIQLGGVCLYTYPLSLVEQASDVRPTDSKII